MPRDMRGWAWHRDLPEVRRRDAMKGRTLARDYNPPQGDSSLGFVVFHGKRNDRSMVCVSALSDAELAWAARVVLAEIGRRKGVNSAEKMVAASA